MKHVLPLALLQACLLLTNGGPAAAAELPPGVQGQLPAGYRVLASAEAEFGGPSHKRFIVALARQDEGAGQGRPHPSSDRPLLIFERRADGTFREAARNSTVVLRADEGGQCDPFDPEAGSGGITVKDRFFTVENGVACGQHWTDYRTFRFDAAAGGYVFDNQRRQSWSLNTSTDPDAEALVPDTPPEVLRGDRRRPVRFENWRPPR